MFPVAMWNHQRVPQTSPTSPPPNIPRNARQSGEIRRDNTHLRPQHNWPQLPPRVRKNHGFTADLHNIVFSEYVPWNLWQTAFVELVSGVFSCKKGEGHIGHIRDISFWQSNMAMDNFLFSSRISPAQMPHMTWPNKLGRFATRKGPTLVVPAALNCIQNNPFGRAFEYFAAFLKWSSNQDKNIKNRNIFKHVVQSVSGDL
jgi:hypothetical protein